MAAARFRPGHAQPAPQTEPVCAACCYHPQSPRSLTAADWDCDVGDSDGVATHAPTPSHYSAARRASTMILHRCSQHYHCRIENVQACPGQSAAPAAVESECPGEPPVGSWVEIHTVYHAGPALNPPPEDIKSSARLRPWWSRGITRK